MAAPDPLHLFRLLAVGETPAARLYFVSTPIVADPIEGLVTDNLEWDRFSKIKSAWLRRLRARIQPLSVTRTAERIVAEATLHLRHEGRTVPLPLVFAADLEGERWKAVRIYHSTWPISGRHLLRAPLLKMNPAIVIPDVIGRYHAALRAGDLETVLSCFAPSGYVREPSGGEFVYQGAARLREMYSSIMPQGAGSTLEYCTLTDDGVRSGLEYNCTQWGRHRLPPQAGLAVYERSPGGLLSAVRIYDDIDPPKDINSPK